MPWATKGIKKTFLSAVVEQGSDLSALSVQGVSNGDRSVLCAFYLVASKLHSSAQEEVCPFIAVTGIVVPGRAKV